MRWSVFMRTLFLVYCIETGAFLSIAPWTAAWDRALLELPFGPTCIVCLHPALRGGVSGFGLMHLVWGAHDLARMWSARKRAL